MLKAKIVISKKANNINYQQPFYNQYQSTIGGYQDIFPNTTTNLFGTFTKKLSKDCTNGSNYDIILLGPISLVNFV